MKQAEIIRETSKYVMSTYNRFPVCLVRGEGPWVWDADGKKQLDFVAGLAVCNLGHCHPAVVEAVKGQAEKLLHVSNLFHIEPQTELASLLVKHSFADKVFFCNSGAEANEAAIKLARRYWYDKGSSRHKIISMRDSFHGRTLATITATGQPKFQEGFAPLPEGFSYVPFNDLEALEKAITPETAAVLLEPIQGEGGVNMPEAGYLKSVKELCRKKGILLIFDEVQTGIGRTGKLFAYEHYGVTPDIMTLAKGLGGGVAIGAMLATDEVAAAFVPGTHASTFGGNPLACAAGLAVIKALTDDNTILNGCRETGDYLREQLTERLADNPSVREIRGKGQMTGIELNRPGREIVNKSLENGLIINCTADTVLRMLPPINIGKTEVDEALKRFTF